MLGLGGILLLGIGAQWLGWRMRVPSILLLLLIGFALGPFTDNALLDLDRLFGEDRAGLSSIVSVCVAVILFEGGLSLRFAELRGAGWAVSSLVVLGPVLTMAIVTVLARFVLAFEWETSALVGATLIVTGPTVIVPLLRHVRPSGIVGRVLRWEGIATDPIGAIVAVLVFEALVMHPDEGIALQGSLRAVLGGTAAGLGGGALLIVLLRRKLVPDFLHAPVALAIAVAGFGLANRIQHESGLLSVTLMGMWIANQRRVAIEHIVEFGENLRVILVAVLFLLLAANVELEQFTRIDLRSLSFVVLLILVARPLVVFLGTIGTELTWREKTLVAWIAPRGIVAAAVSSVFALELDPLRFPAAAEKLVPVIFLVIIVTVLVYGLTAAPLARRLGLANAHPQGVLFVGAHSWTRSIALALKKCGYETLLVDTNFGEVQQARIEGLEAHFGNVLADDFALRVPLDGIGSLLSMTHNDEVNALACLQFAPEFGRLQVFQIEPEQRGKDDELPKHLRGLPLFRHGVDYWDLEARFRAGAQVKTTGLSAEFGYEDFLATHDRPEAPVVPMFRIEADRTLHVVSADETFDPQPGETVVALVGPAPTPEAEPEP